MERHEWEKFSRRLLKALREERAKLRRLDPDSREGVKVRARIVYLETRHKTLSEWWITMPAPKGDEL